MSCKGRMNEHSDYVVHGRNMMIEFVFQVQQENISKRCGICGNPNLEQIRKVVIFHTQIAWDHGWSLGI